MAPMVIPRVMDEMNDDDEDPSKDVEPRTKKPKLSDEEDVEPRTKQPKLSDEEEMAPESSGGGLSCAAVTQAETTDPESSATYSVSAYEDDLRFFERLHANDDDVELFHQQEAIRRLNFAKKLCTMYSVDFYRYWEDLLKEFEMEGVIAPNDWGAKQCLIVRCDKFFAVNRNVAYYKLLESLVDFAPYMQPENEVDEGGLEWLKEKGHLTILCNYFIDEKEIRFALRELNELCYHMEWRYHPLITKGHRDDFLTIIKRRAGANRQKVKQTYEDYSFVMSFWADFINNLVDKCKEASPSYQRVAEQVALHDEFDSYLDSCESIEHDSSINELLGDETVVTRQFSLLDKELVKESLNAKIYVLKKVHEVESYFTCLESLVRQRIAGTYDFDILLKQLTDEGLFKFSNLPTDKPIRENWSSKFYELLDKARHAAFAHFPEHYVVIGLLDYSFIFSINGEHHESQSVEERLAAVRYNCNLKTDCLIEGLWVTKHYAHPIYEQFGDALKLIDLPSTTI